MNGLNPGSQYGVEIFNESVREIVIAFVTAFVTEIETEAVTGHAEWKPPRNGIQQNIRSNKKRSIFMDGINASIRVTAVHKGGSVIFEGWKSKNWQETSGSVCKRRIHISQRILKGGLRGSRHPHGAPK